MVLHERKRRMLQVLAQGSRGARHFTHADGGNCSPAVVDAYLGQLQALGYVEEIGPHFHITDAGRDVLAEQLPQVESRVYGNASTPPGSLTGARWNVRAGAENHKALPSLGAGA